MHPKQAGVWGIFVGILGIIVLSPFIFPGAYAVDKHIIALLFCFEAPLLFLYHLLFPINPTEDIPDFLTLGESILFLMSPICTVGLFYSMGYVLSRFYPFITKK